MDETKQELRKKIEGAHEKHAWTLAEGVQNFV